MKIIITGDNQFDELGGEYLQEKEEEFEFEDNGDTIIMRNDNFQGVVYLDKSELKWLKIMIEK